LSFQHRSSTQCVPMFCSLAGDGLVYGCYQLKFTQRMQRLFVICCDCKDKDLILFFQSTQLKFINQNTCSKFSWMFFKWHQIFADRWKIPRKSQKLDLAKILCQTVYRKFYPTLSFTDQVYQWEQFPAKNGQCYAVMDWHPILGWKLLFTIQLK